MLKTILVLGLAGAVLCQERIYPVQTASIGSVGITHVDLRGFLIPTISRSGSPTIVFRTRPSEGEDLPGDFLQFRCSVLDESYVTRPDTTAMFCRGDAYERGGVMERMAFLFSTEGLEPSAGGGEVELMMERDVVNGLVALPGTIIGTTILGDHA